MNNEKTEKKDFTAIATDILESLRICNFAAIVNEPESINSISRHLEKYDFKTDRSLEAELLQDLGKDYILNNIESILRILCTSDDLEHYNLKTEIYVLWQLKDALKVHLSKN